MGAKPTTLSGLSGSGDIMLTCFVNLSRNRNVGLRLGSGEKLDEIMNSMNQVWSIPAIESTFGWMLPPYIVLIYSSHCIGCWRCINCWGCHRIGSEVPCKNASLDSSSTDNWQWTNPKEGCYGVNESSTGHTFNFMFDSVLHDKLLYPANIAIKILAF